MSKLVKSKERVKQLGEVFTPSELVNEMLDKLPSECWHEDKTFLDPACGNGNFLVEVVQRKLFCGHSPIQALSTTYGIDIMEDNVRECKERLYAIVSDRLSKEETDLILNRNIICEDTLSLDFSGDWPPQRILNKKSLSKKEKIQKQTIKKAARNKRVQYTQGNLKQLLFANNDKENQEPDGVKEIHQMVNHLNPKLKLNGTKSYLAIKFGNKNLIYSGYSKQNVVVFKVSNDVIIDNFSISSKDLISINDGKNVWPAILFQSKQHILDHKKAIIEIFQNYFLS